MMYHAVLNADFDLGEIPTYEDVELLPPNKTHKRPLVLIGKQFYEDFDLLPPNKKHKRPLVLIGKHSMKMLNCYLQIKNINVHWF